KLMEVFTLVFKHLISNSFYPVPHPAIGVGSAFEGWSPREDDVVYRMFIPLSSPRGFDFHLELDTAGQMPGRNFRIHVKPVCICNSEQEDNNVPCLLHHSKEELQNQGPTLLDTLCTGFYLDVQKTAHWFYQLVKKTWVVLPQSKKWRLVLMPISRSCKFKVTRATESYVVEVLFGVQRGDSDIFVSCQNIEALFTPRTVWPETYAVAEAKFFRHIAEWAPHDSMHCQCLQLYARLLVGSGFSTYTLKTIVMHLRHFVPRMKDILEYLRRSVKEKCLEHFIVGNKVLHQNIILPLDIKTADPHNLFHHLEHDLLTYTKMRNEFCYLQNR
ncbi:Inositol 1,4,5-trisphosphate receptor-interacting protein-like 1, partial [Acanthisitta chloris]